VGGQYFSSATERVPSIGTVVPVSGRTRPHCIPTLCRRTQVYVVLCAATCVDLCRSSATFGYVCVRRDVDVHAATSGYAVSATYVYVRQHRRRTIDTPPQFHNADLACILLLLDWPAHDILPLTAFKAILDLPSGKVPIQSWADHICLMTYMISV
jgi:hypothetical protein